MNSKRQLATQGLVMALQVRQSRSIMPWQALCVFDVAESSGTCVRFDDLNSMEGMYSKKDATILVSTNRGFGRRAFTCAHELGHHVFGHGVHVDQLVEFAARESNPEDFLADCFAGFLLMPKLAVDKGFTSRGWAVRDCTAQQVFVVAGWFGVGYETLVKHMHFSLGVIDAEQKSALLKSSPRSLRALLLGTEVAEDVFVVDGTWADRAVDLQVGDLIVAPPDCVSDGAAIKPVGSVERGIVFKAVCPGISSRLTIEGTEWAAHVRVSRRGFVGWNMYRNLEDPDHGHE